MKTSELKSVEKKRLKALPLNKELVMAGFSITNSDALKKIRKLWAKQRKVINSKRVLGRSRKETVGLTSKDMGGEIVLLDADNINGSMLRSMKVRTPMGLYYSKANKMLFTGSDHWIYGLAGGKIIKTLNNQCFNCIHCLTGSFDNKLWVVSTGIDAVIKIDINCSEKILSSWFATENGYAVSANGSTRHIDRSKNHQGINDYSTPEHTTHINSVLEYRKNKLLATLFHQGELVEIDIKTGKTKIILGGLKEPHNIRRASFGYIVSDTNGQRVIKFDKFLQVTGEIKGKFDWVQDAIELKNGNIVIADANNGRIVVTNLAGSIIGEYIFGKDNKRIGVLSTIKVKEAINVFCQ